MTVVFMDFPQNLCDHMPEQECIPVGCVLPTAIAAFSCHACPLPHTCPPAMHAPCHAGPTTCPPAMQAPVTHACSPATHTLPYHAHIPPCHACPPCEQNSWHMLVKTLPCHNFVVGGKKITLLPIMGSRIYWFVAFDRIYWSSCRMSCGRPAKCSHADVTVSLSLPDKYESLLLSIWFI